MVTPSQKRALTVWSVGIWLILGPFISFYLFQLVVPETPPPPHMTKRSSRAELRLVRHFL